MLVATKLGLAEFFEREAASHAQRCGTDTPWTHHMRAAAFALRLLTEGQEAEFLEWQVGGPDGIGPDSYDNPIKIVSPLKATYSGADELPPPRRGWWNWRD